MERSLPLAEASSPAAVRSFSIGVTDASYRKLVVAMGLGQNLCWWKRRTLAVAGVVLFAGGVWSSAVVGQVSSRLPDRQAARPLSPAQPTTYRDVLIFGLKARLPSELAYIDSVVDAVEDKKIPPTLVAQTFFWARTHAGQTMYGQPNRPIIYFIPALNARLKKLRIAVDLDGGLP